MYVRTTEIVTDLFLENVKKILCRKEKVATCKRYYVCCSKKCIQAFSEVLGSINTVVGFCVVSLRHAPAAGRAEGQP
jgi:hypothetical protein